MRILHISTRLILGGSQENTVLSCEGQAGLGHDVHLAFGPIYGPEGSLLERVQRFRTADGRGITTHVVPHLVRQINPIADVRAAKELRRLIRELQPKIVHTHSSKAGTLGRAAAWAEGGRASLEVTTEREGRIIERRRRNVRGVIHTIHGPPFMPIEGSPAQRATTRLNNALYTAAERFAASRCHAIVSVADAMTRQFLARGIGNPDQYTTVYSGMETEPYLSPAPGQSRADVRARLGLSGDDILIGTVARLAQHKGHDDLLDALAADLRTHPGWRLLWIGDGWWRQRLIARARTIGIPVRELDRTLGPASTPPQVLITGLVPPEQVPGYVRALDVLAHPSYREGLPRTIPQALLCGVAPVAYDVDGTSEVCREMETGRLVPPGDVRALRDAVTWLIEHPRERAEMASRGREWCRDRFSAGRMVQELEKVYARSLELARGR
jgi:glycosyltransferase involved in cell wall biosynthesis